MRNLVPHQLTLARTAPNLRDLAGPGCHEVFDKIGQSLVGIRPALREGCARGIGQSVRRQEQPREILRQPLRRQCGLFYTPRRAGFG